MVETPVYPGERHPQSEKGFEVRTPEEKKWNPPPAHIVPKQVDAMPKEVATEMLLRMGNKLSGPERRAYERARYRYFESDRVKKEPTDVLAKRLMRATWAQLTKWERRAIVHRKGVQDAHQILTRRILEAKEAKPVTKEETVKLGLKLTFMEKALALLDLKAAQLDVFWDAVDTEKGRRGLLIENLRKMRLNETADSLEAATINN